MVEWDRDALPITVQAELLSLNRSGLYYHPVEPSAEEIQIKHKIDEIYTQWPVFGSRRITAMLRRKGININRKAVQRHMQEMGIAGICPEPNLSKRRQKDQVYPYLLKGLAITRQNQVWGTDITYIRLKGGWLYLAAIIDWYSRYVVSWEMDQTLEIGFVLNAVQKSLTKGRPDIINSDQGSHFTSSQYTGIVHGAGVQISMEAESRDGQHLY